MLFTITMRRMFSIFLSLLLLFLDQASKWYVVTHDIRHFLNTGIAFSIPFSGWYLVMMYVIVTCFFIYLYRDGVFGEGKVKAFLVSLVFAGGVGNLLDRIFHGGVVDFIFIGSFPAFNLADSFLTVAGALFLWRAFRS